MAYDGEWSESARRIVKDHLDYIFDETKTFRSLNMPLCPDKPGLQGMVFGIDGGIGAGKTSLGLELERELGTAASFQEEYVNRKWLALFYGDKKRHAATFQVNQLATCVAASKVMVERCRHGAIGIVDRTIMGNFCFAVLQLLRGFISSEVFLCYLSTLVDSGPYLYCDVVFLLVKPEIAKKRVDLRTLLTNKRDPERNGIDLQYLRELDCVMLFVTLYARARGILRVDFVNWDSFGPARRIATRVFKAKRPAPEPDEQLLERLLSADYQQLRQIACGLCIDIHSADE